MDNINIKFRTTNSLENFNRVFKNEFNQKEKVENTVYIDTLITIFREQNDFFQKELEKQPKENKKNTKKNNLQKNPKNLYI